MGGTGPSSGWWGGAIWGLYLGGFVIFALAHNLLAGAVCLGSATIAAAIRECR